MALHPLTVCADDFGQSRGISLAIGDLVRARRINAFSCLTNGASWAQDAPQVAALRPQAEVGLHFNLSEGRPLSAALAAHWPQLPPLKRLLLDAHLGRLPAAAIADELSAQWAAFVHATGVRPDFIDGHQHVHHLPGVRPHLLALAERERLPVRATGRVLGPGSAVKRLLIAGTGGGALTDALRRARLPHNAALIGCYGFDTADYRGLMRGWLESVPPEGALLFCHPGRKAKGDGPDAIATARERELAYFNGPDWLDDLAEAGVVLAPCWRL